MAFSLFGKKPPPAPLGGKGSARPATKPAPVPAAASAAKQREELAALDFTQPGEMAKRSLARIEVQETFHEIPAAIEQSAVLFSAEQPDAACAPLEGAIHAEDLGLHARRAWGMLFELYQLLGKQGASSNSRSSLPPGSRLRRLRGPLPTTVPAPPKSVPAARRPWR